MEERSKTDSVAKFCLTTPIPPSINQLYATFRGRRIVSRKGKEWKEGIRTLTAFEKDRQNWVYSIGKKLIMEIWIWWPDYRKRDADNILKIIQDAFTGILYDDDKWILPRIMDWEVDKNKPRVEVKITYA